MRIESFISYNLMRSPLVHAILAALLLTLLSAAQAASQASVPVGVERLQEGQPSAWMHAGDHAEIVPVSSEVPCVHHEPGSQCAPCQHCSTPAAEVPELLVLIGSDVRIHGPPGVTQYFPASLFKPPRQTR